MTEYLAPGVYIEEVPFKSHPIEGVPGDAFFIRCDETTTTQADIDSGVFNIIVGFAPLKAAEFILIRIQQLAGQCT